MKSHTINDYISVTSHDQKVVLHQNEWEYCKEVDIKEHPELRHLNAREIIESSYYTDSEYSFICDVTPVLTDDEDAICTFRKMLYDKIYGALFDEYCDAWDYFDNQLWSGRVAVIYTNEEEEQNVV